MSIEEIKNKPSEPVDLRKKNESPDKPAGKSKGWPGIKEEQIKEAQDLIAEIQEKPKKNDIQKKDEKISGGNMIENIDEPEDKKEDIEADSEDEIVFDEQEFDRQLEKGKDEIVEEDSGLKLRAKKELENIKKMPFEKKKSLFESAMNMGYWASEKKNRFFAKSLEATSKFAIKFEKGEKQGVASTFFEKLGKTYGESALNAQRKRETIGKSAISSSMGGLQGAGVLFKLGRVLYDFKHANPFRHATAIAMVGGRVMEAGKDSRLEWDSVKEKTRIDKDKAYDEAMKIYKQAEAEAGKNCKKVSSANLEKAYVENIPEDLRERLKKIDFDSTRFYQKAFEKDAKGKVERIVRKIQKIKDKGYDKTKEENKIQNYLSRKEKELKDLDAIISREGLADKAASWLRVGEKVSKGVATSLILDSAYRVFRASGSYLAWADKFFEGNEEQATVLDDRVVQALKNLPPEMVEDIKEKGLTFAVIDSFLNDDNFSGFKKELESIKGNLEKSNVSKVDIYDIKPKEADSARMKSAETEALKADVETSEKKVSDKTDLNVKAEEVIKQEESSKKFKQEDISKVEEDIKKAEELKRHREDRGGFTKNKLEELGKTAQNQEKLVTAPEKIKSSKNFSKNFQELFKGQEKVETFEIKKGGSVSEALDKNMPADAKVTVFNPDGSKLENFDANLVHAGDTVVEKDGEIYVFKTSGIAVENGQSLDKIYDKIERNLDKDGVPKDIREHFNADKEAGGLHNRINKEEAAAAREFWNNLNEEQKKQWHNLGEEDKTRFFSGENLKAAGGPSSGLQEERIFPAGPPETEISASQEKITDLLHEKLSESNPNMKKAEIINKYNKYKGAFERMNIDLAGNFKEDQLKKIDYIANHFNNLDEAFRRYEIINNCPTLDPEDAYNYYYQFESFYDEADPEKSEWQRIEGITEFIKSFDQKEGKFDSAYAGPALSKILGRKAVWHEIKGGTSLMVDNWGNKKLELTVDNKEIKISVRKKAGWQFFSAKEPMDEKPLDKNNLNKAFRLLSGGRAENDSPNSASTEEGIINQKTGEKETAKIADGSETEESRPKKRRYESPHKVPLADHGAVETELETSEEVEIAPEPEKKKGEYVFNGVKLSVRPLEDNGFNIYVSGRYTGGDNYKTLYNQENINNYCSELNAERKVIFERALVVQARLIDMEIAAYREALKEPAKNNMIIDYLEKDFKKMSTSNKYNIIKWPEDIKKVIE